MAADQADDDRFRPAAPWANLRLRAGLLERLRAFFRWRGFLEVETPLLSADVVVDRHLEPFTTRLLANPRSEHGAASTGGRTLYLQTSPEAAMKRLLASGGEALYQVTRSFRNAERGPLHNPEFTIVEWYRAGDDLATGMQLLAELCVEMLPTEPPMRLSYAEAFTRFAGVDPHAASTAELERAGRDAGHEPPEGMAGEDRDAWLEWLLVARVEPHLGRERPAILYDYPASQAALAQVRPGDPPLAERFELYVEGIELANGFAELLDADELARREQEANEQRRQEGRPPLPGAPRLAAAMRHGLPVCSGTALGFDRLVMLVAGAKSIDEVIAFPIDRA